jgi:hypothetical protein
MIAASGASKARARIAAISGFIPQTWRGQKVEQVVPFACLYQDRFAAFVGSRAERWLV